jgi:hypothetical protein
VINAQMVSAITHEMAAAAAINIVLTPDCVTLILLLPVVELFNEHNPVIPE